MAQRTIHMLFAALAAERLELKDQNRFFMGSILPDAYRDPEQRRTAHFIKRNENENTEYYDFHEFLDRYHEEVMQDDLYLGYYAHLAEDAFYRRFLYHEKGFVHKIGDRRLDILHGDYAILNSYIVKKWSLPQKLFSLPDFDKERLNEITDFDVEQMMTDYADNLNEKVDGKASLFTEELLDEFVETYTEKLIDELKQVRESRTSGLCVQDYRWVRRK